MPLVPSVWSSFFRRMTPEDAVRTFKKHGFSTMELSRDHADDLMKRGSGAAVEFRSFIEGEGFPIKQAHVVMLNVLGEHAQRDLGVYKRWVEFLCEIDIKYIVVHLGRGLVAATGSEKEIFDKKVVAARALSDMLIGTDKYICIENLVANMRTSREISEVLDAVRSPRLAVCYDTGHLNENHTLETQTHFVESLNSNIKAIHLNNNEGFFEQHLLPFSCCLNVPAERNVHTVDFTEVMRALVGIGYHGTMNFELPGESEAPTEILEAKLDYIKAIADYLNGIR